MGKPVGIAILILVVLLLVVLYVWVNLNGIYLLELQSIPNIAGFYTFAIGLFVPVGIILRVGWNFPARRATNPLTKRFVPTWIAVMAVIIFGLIWYFVVLSQLDRYFLTLLTSSLMFTLSSVLWFILWTILLGAMLMVIFAALAIPSKFKTALGFVAKI